MSDEIDGADLKPGMVIRGIYTVLAKLGSGSFGTVWKVSEAVKGRGAVPRAMKVMGTEKETKHEKWALDILAGSQYTPRFYSLFPLGLDYVLVMSLGIGDLKRYREANGSGEFKPRTSMIVTWHILHALEYLHSQNVVHRDMKEDNVCIKHRPSDRVAPILLIDYGYSEEISKAREDKEEDRTLGSSCYCTPHMEEGKQSTKGCDLRMAIYATMLGRGINVMEDGDGETSLKKRQEMERTPEKYITENDIWLREVAKIVYATQGNSAPKYDDMYNVLKTAEDGFTPEKAKLVMSDNNGVECIV